MFPNTQDLAERQARMRQIDAGIFALLDERVKLLIQINTMRQKSSHELDKLSEEAEDIIKVTKANLETETQEESLEKLNLIWGKMLELEGRIAE